MLHALHVLQTEASDTVDRLSPVLVAPAPKNTKSANKRISSTQKSMHEFVVSTESKSSTCASIVDTKRQIEPRVTRSRSKVSKLQYLHVLYSQFTVE